MLKAAQGHTLTEEESSIVKVIDKYMDQFLAADKIVIAFPLWNLSAPTPLVTYMSYIAQPGKTFKYTAEGPIGLTSGKKVLLLSARGGDYTDEFKQFVESAVKPTKYVFLGMLGIPVEEHVIEGHQQFPDRANEIIESGLEETKKLAASF